MKLPPDDPFRPYGKLPLRRRVLIAGLAVVVAVSIILALFVGPNGVRLQPPPPPADVANCAPGQTTHCVGSTTQVITPAPPR